MKRDLVSLRAELDALIEEEIAEERMCCALDIVDTTPWGVEIAHKISLVEGLILLLTMEGDKNVA